jgi:hypothetical protein
VTQLNFKIVGTPGNYVLERLDAEGKSVSARPASAEEFQMYGVIGAQEKDMVGQDSLIAAYRDAWRIHSETCPEAK